MPPTGLHPWLCSRAPVCARHMLPNDRLRGSVQDRQSATCSRSSTHHHRAQGPSPRTRAMSRWPSLPLFTVFCMSASHCLPSSTVLVVACAVAGAAVAGRGTSDCGTRTVSVAFLCAGMTLPRKGPLLDSAPIFEDACSGDVTGGACMSVSVRFGSVAHPCAGPVDKHATYAEQCCSRSPRYMLQSARL